MSKARGFIKCSWVKMTMVFAAARTRRGREAGQVGRLRRLAVALSAAGLAAGVVIPMTSMAAVSQAAGPPAPVLRWHACDNGFQCATARVPLDYQDPNGATISIAVIRHLATDPARRLGSLFFNSGGPAEQIDPFLASYPEIPAELRARYDVVSFDPRGFGFSTAISCFPTLAAEQKFLAGEPLFPVGRQQDLAWEKTTARFDALCASRGGPLIAHDSTADVARDMNLLRQAVGDPVLNYLGQSYGTGLGAVYANLFPATVGHLVLDGNLNPVAWTHGTGLPAHMREGTDISDAQTMQAFLDLCGKTSVTACAFSAGTPAATSAKFEVLSRRLLQQPITIGSPAQTWTYADVYTAFPEYDISAWPADAALLQQLWAASAPGTRPPASSGASPVPPPPSIEQIVAVGCADSDDPRDPADYAAAARLGEMRAGGFGLMAAWEDEFCAAWPQVAGQDRYSGPWNRWTANPILLIGNTVDPATPYSGSVAMSHDLARARLLTVKGYGHTEFTNPSTCAADDEVRYLTTGALPPAGTVCQQNGIPFPSASR
jgi:pimeloyl-ACP methyl ester carboxylesterase